MGQTESSDSGDGASVAVGRSFPGYVDWIAAAVVALAGMGLTVGGTALTLLVDRALLEEGVESGQIRVVVFQRDLTRAEMLEVADAVVSWTGIGLLITGLGLVLFAVGYVVARRRARRRAGPGEPAGSYFSSAVLGAVATTVLSFVPASPVLGGAVAGYLERYGSERTVGAGALSGLLAVLPALVILLFVTVGSYQGLDAVQESNLGIVATAAMVLLALFAATVSATLGAVGGFAGGRLAERRN